MAAITNLEKWIASYIRQIQELEQFFFQLRTIILIDSSSGAQLDGIGRIVVEPRSGRNDPNYRVGLKTRILINQSDGVREDIIEVVKKGLTASHTAVVTESDPVHFDVLVPQTIDFLAAKRTSGAAESFVLAAGQDLDIQVDGGGTQNVVFNAIDFVDIATASAAEVALVINNTTTGITAITQNSRLVVESNTVGTLSSIEIIGGTANTGLDFTLGLRTGPEESVDYMQRVATNMLQAKPTSVRGIIIWNNSTTSFGFLGTIGALGFGAGAFASAASS